MTRCACSHDVEQHHPAGRCMAVLPADDAAELPAWGCPCRKAVASAVTTRLLASVQSCTVLAPPQAPEQRVSIFGQFHADALLRLAADRREWPLVRTHP